MKNFTMWIQILGRVKKILILIFIVMSGNHVEYLTRLSYVRNLFNLSGFMEGEDF